MNTEGILFVDDERSSHRYFVRAFENAYPVHCAACAEEALRIMHTKNDIAVVVQARSGNPKDPAVFLHCAQRIVNSCGGWTSVGPGSLDGTRFTFTIPESKNDCCREAAVPCLPEERLTDTIVQ